MLEFGLSAEFFGAEEIAGGAPGRLGAGKEVDGSGDDGTAFASGEWGHVGPGPGQVEADGCGSAGDVS
jgi:hypothetical protein